MTNEVECDVHRRIREQNISIEEALAQTDMLERDLLEQHGWYVHCLTDGPPNIHTHGLPENFRHLDLQIRLPARPDDLHIMLVALVDAIKRGVHLVDGMETHAIFNVPIRFVERHETGRQVIRAIFPDPDGRFPGDKDCSLGYNEQLIQDA